MRVRYPVTHRELTWTVGARCAWPENWRKPRPLHIEGRLRIDLYPVAGGCNRVGIQSSRPLQVAQVFAGRQPQEVLAQVPLLFSVCCGVAQATAAARALGQVLVQAPGQVAAPVDRARDLLVHLETAREHLWRILIVWPELLGESVVPRSLAPLQALAQSLRQALFATAMPSLRRNFGLTAAHRAPASRLLPRAAANAP